MDELEARLDAIVAKATATLETSRELLKKGFPSGQADAGVHLHNLNRELGRTKLDGLHCHVFRIPEALTFRTEDGEEVSLEAGAFLVTEEDGPHLHELSDGGLDIAAPGGSEHRHIISVVDGKVELFTATDGAHSHDLQVWSSAFDGAHKHYLRIADLELESLSGAEFWAALDEPAMQAIPPAPAASELAVAPDSLELDPEELDVRIANVALSKRSLVVDPIDDLARLAKLDPALERLGKISTINELGEIVLDARKKSDVPVLVWQAEPPVGRLPSLKVPDPAIIVERLRDGLPTGLVSKQRQGARVGRPQALVNEVSSGKAAVWAIVSQGKPVPVDSVEELTGERRDEIADVLDSRTVASLSSGKLWYLPLKLAVVFDPPLELRSPPAGRRFAAEVDFERDVIRARQLTIDELLRLSARKSIADFVHDPAPTALRKSSDSTLVEVDRGLHELFDDLFAGNSTPEAADLPRRQIVSAHVLALRELESRGIETVERDALATETAAFVRGEYPAEPPEPAEAKKQVRGEGHIHPLPAPLEGFTEPGIGRDHTHAFADALGELRQTGPAIKVGSGENARHRHLVSIDLGETGTEHTVDGARKADDSSSEPVEKSRNVRVVKAEEVSAEERYVFGVVLVPNEPDAQGDVYSAAEVRKAAHSFMEHFGGDTFKVMHGGEPVTGVSVLETYVSKAPETYSGETFPVGTWFLATRVIDDELWAAIQQGAFTGYSMGGTALREALAQ